MLPVVLLLLLLLLMLMLMLMFCAPRQTGQVSRTCTLTQCCLCSLLCHRAPA